MHIRNYAATGILFAAAIGLSACDGGDPTTTGSTNPPAAQGEETPTQALPAPTEGQEGTTGSESTNSGG